MATDTAGGVSTYSVAPVVHRLYKAFTYADDGSTLELGWVPENSLVLRGGVVVTTAFNAGTTNVLDIGTADDADGFATDLALGTVGVIAADEMATTNDANCTTRTKITCSVDLTGTAATTGAGVAWVEYIIKN